jgi:hypothetical protein
MLTVKRFQDAFDPFRRILLEIKVQIAIICGMPDFGNAKSEQRPHFRFAFCLLLFALIDAFLWAVIDLKKYLT